jgi:hypothetical protein
MSVEEFQQEILRARAQDHAQLVDKLNDLSENDHRILSTLKEQGGTQKRMEDLLISVLKVCPFLCSRNCCRKHAPVVCAKSRNRAV